MHSVSGVDLISAKLQSTLLQAQKKFETSNPGSSSKNLRRKERKRLNKLKRQFPAYKNLSDQSPTPLGISTDFNQDIFGNTNNWNPAQIQIDLEEVGDSNIFINQVKAKYECLNSTHNLGFGSETVDECEEIDFKHRGGKRSSAEHLLGALPSCDAKNEDVDSGVDSLGGSSLSSTSIPSSARLEPSLTQDKFEKTKAKKKKKKNLDKNKTKLQNLLVRRLNSVNSEETEKLLPNQDTQKLSSKKSATTDKKFRKMKDISADTDVDSLPSTNSLQSPSSSLNSASSSKISASPSNSNGNGTAITNGSNGVSRPININGSTISPSSASPAKLLSPARPTLNHNINSPNGKIPQLPQPKHVLYPREKIQPGWKERMPVGCGFTNMGNSCYMNATLQALFHIPSFVNWLLGDTAHRNKCKGYLGNQFTNSQCIVCAMYNTLEEVLRNHQSQSTRPAYIHNRLKVICKHFTQGRQEDAHEFLRYLLESMERSYLTTLGALRVDVRSKETTPVGQIFGGYIRTEVTCIRCYTVSTTFQPLAELQLDIRHVTSLEDAITNHFKKETLDNNDYKCEKCRTCCAATKQFSLEVPPIALCLQLKRFNPYGMKITKPIYCNKTLNLTRFLHKSLQQANHKDVNYKLTSLITHIGSSPNCGHYTAIARAANGNWYQFDDSYVRSVPPQQAVNSDAYVIIYELDSGNFEKPSSCYNGHYSNNSSNNGLSSLKPTSVNSPNNLSKLLTSNSEVKNGITSSPSTNGNSSNDTQARPKFENPFKKSADKLANSNKFAWYSPSSGNMNGSVSKYTNGINGVATPINVLEKREKVSFSLNNQSQGGTKPNSSGNKILLKNPDAHIPQTSSYLTPSARSRQSTLSEKTLASLNALASATKQNGKLSNGGTESIQSDEPSLLKAELLSPVKKPVVEVPSSSKAALTKSESSASLVPYEGEEEEGDATNEKEGAKDPKSPKSPKLLPKASPAELVEVEQNNSSTPDEDRHAAQSPPPVKYFPVFKKAAAPLGTWDSQKSAVDQIEETVRKREKSREELEDEEFDAGHVNPKKRKTDELSRSRMSSGTERDQYGNIFLNKFQQQEDRRRMVGKMLIPSSASSSSTSLLNLTRPNGNGFHNGTASGSFNGSSGGSGRNGFGDAERRNSGDRTTDTNDRHFNNERRDNSSSNNSRGFVKYASPNFYRDNSSNFNARNRSGYRGFGSNGYRNDSFRRGGFSSNSNRWQNRFNNRNGNGNSNGGYYNKRDNRY